MTRVPLVQLAHQSLKTVLNDGDIAIDATVGNGHDTLFLASCVGTQGKVYGFDIQQQALDSAYQRLEGAGQAAQVSLFHAGHEAMSILLPESIASRVQAVMFNLGYLPGGDKSRTTGVNTTLAALQQSLSLLAVGGVISVMAYTGHPGGRDEAEQVKAWAKTLPQDLYEVSLLIPPSEGPSAPEWISIRRL